MTRPLLPHRHILADRLEVVDGVEFASASPSLCILSNFFNSGPFMPHGHCYFWTKGLIALHAISDALIVLAYYSIPLTLVYFVRRRKDLEFNWMFVCFAIFIMACGTTHLMEIWNIRHANYWFSGCIKGLTALASVPTAMLLLKLVPQTVTLPSPSQLRRGNEAFQAEIADSKKGRTKIPRLAGVSAGRDRHCQSPGPDCAREFADGKTLRISAGGPFGASR